MISIELDVSDKPLQSKASLVEKKTFKTSKLENFPIKGELSLIGKYSKDQVQPKPSGSFFNNPNYKPETEKKVQELKRGRMENNKEKKSHGFLKQTKNIKILHEKHKDIFLGVINDDDIFCDVCLSGDSYEDNEIIICELCNTACHQSCYGSELLSKVPEGDWFCQRCRKLISKNLDSTRVKCKYCPELMGIIKKIRINKTSDKIWAHISCIYWNERFYFCDENIDNFDVINNFKKLRKNICNLCNINYGECRKGLILPHYIMEKMTESSDPSKNKVFCLKHIQVYPDLVEDSNAARKKNERINISCKLDLNQVKQNRSKDMGSEGFSNNEKLDDKNQEYIMYTDPNESRTTQINEGIEASLEATSGNNKTLSESDSENDNEKLNEEYLTVIANLKNSRHFINESKMRIRKEKSRLKVLKEELFFLKQKILHSEENNGNEVSMLTTQIFESTKYNDTSDQKEKEMESGSIKNPGREKTTVYIESHKENDAVQLNNNSLEKKRCKPKLSKPYANRVFLQEIEKKAKPKKRFNRKYEEVLLLEDSLNWLINMKIDEEFPHQLPNYDIHNKKPCFDLE